MFANEMNEISLNGKFLTAIIQSFDFVLSKSSGNCMNVPSVIAFQFKFFFLFKF